jgi:pilus assembly protein Flp/PilA
MRKFASAAWLFLKAEDGPTAVEYAVMLALIIMACFTAVATVGAKTNSIFQNAASSIH